MRYTPAVVLSTLAVGQVAALHNRHASFHERRQAEVKRDIEGVDWSKVAYDLSNVNWSTVKYNLPGQSTPTPAPQAAAAQPASPAAPAPAATSAAVVQAQSTSNTNTNLAADVLQAGNALMTKLGIKAGVNSNSNNGGGMWIGSDSQWKVTFSNQASDTAVLVCWAKDGYTGPFVQVYAPQISTPIGPGQSTTISWAGNVGSACAPIFPDTGLETLSHYIYNTWFEVTFPGGGGSGAFDISRLPFMNGRTITAKGSMCSADMNTCSYTCDSGLSCMTGYTLNNCNSGNGGGGGYNAKDGGVGGGCSMSQSAETINVSLH